MTEEQRKAIIELEAQAAGLSFLGPKGSDKWNALFDFVIIHDREQAARNQSNNVPVAWHIKSTLWDYVEKDYEIAKLKSARGAKLTPLYTSPQQSNALEMAANLLMEFADVHGDASVADLRALESEIRNIIPQSESDGK